MKERFTVGIDYTYDQPKVYIKGPDGRIHFFNDGREVGEVVFGLLSAQRFFVHPTMFEKPPGDRQIIGGNK